MTKNGAIFDPVDKSLVISAKVEDIFVLPESDGRVTIGISKLHEGIEIVHEDEDVLWWPV
jgi:hypothetical protein